MMARGDSCSRVRWQGRAKHGERRWPASWRYARIIFREIRQKPERARSGRAAADELSTDQTVMELCRGSSSSRFSASMLVGQRFFDAWPSFQFHIYWYSNFFEFFLLVNNNCLVRLGRLVLLSWRIFLFCFMSADADAGWKFTSIVVFTGVRNFSYFFCDRLLSVFSFFIGVKSKDISSFCVTFRNDDGNLRSWTVHVNRCIYWKLSRFYWNWYVIRWSCVLIFLDESMISNLDER